MFKVESRGDAAERAVAPLARVGERDGGVDTRLEAGGFALGNVVAMAVVSRS